MRERILSADDVLQIIRDSCTSNGQFLEDLKDRITSSGAIPLVPFVGAGLSMPMGFPSWGAFLTQLARECGKSDEVSALIMQGKYQDAATVVECGQGATIFNRRVAQTFGDRASKTCQLKGPILELPGLASGPVVTTNFDRTLERTFSEAGSPFEHIAWGSMVDTIRRAMATNRPFLLKFHGDAEERTGRVLTAQEYDEHYASGNPQNLRAQLGRVFQGRTLLFLGCSLGSDRTMDVISEVLHQASGLEHFAIVEKPASDVEFYAKQKQLGDRAILPIWYATGRHDLIQPLVRWIADLQYSRSEYTVLKAERILTFKDALARRATVERCVTLRANRSGVEEVWFRTISCDGGIENKLIDGAKPDAGEPETGVWRLCKKFSPALECGEQRTIRLSYDVVEAFKPDDPLKFHCPIDDETRKLRITINFHPEKPCLDADLSFVGEHERPLPNLLRIENGGGRADAEINNPLRGYEYIVHWNW
jgi:hypothetical protein